MSDPAAASADLPLGFTVDASSADLPPGFTVDAAPVAQASTAEEPFWSKAGRFLGTAATNAVAGIGDMLMNNGMAHASALAYDQMHPSQPATDLNAASYPAARQTLLGVTGLSPYEPSTMGGRLGMAATSGGLTALLTGNPAAIPSMMGGSASSEAARELFPEHPAVAGLLGFIPGAGAANMAAQGISHGIGALAGNSVSPVYQAYRNLGVRTDLTGDVTGNPSLQTAQGRAMGSSVGQDAAKGTLQDWQNAFSDTAGKLGSARTLQDVGTTLQSSAQNWLDNFKNTYENVKNSVASLVPPDTPVMPTETAARVDDMLGKWGNVKEQLSNVVGSEKLQSIKDALDSITAETGGSMDYQAMEAFRTRIGALLKSNMPLGDAATGELKNLYGGLSEDMKNGAYSVSQKAGDAAQAVNDYYAQGRQVYDNYIDPILTAESPEKAASWALSGANKGGSRLNGVIGAMPDVQGDLGSYTLTNLAGGKNSPTTFATSLEGKSPQLSPEARTALFPDPAINQNVSDLSTVGKAMRTTESAANNSKTSSHLESGPMGLIGKLLLAREGAELGHSAAGIPGAIAGGAAGFMAPGLANTAARLTAVNPLISRLYSYTPAAQFQSPGVNLPLLGRVPAPLPALLPQTTGAYDNQPSLLAR